MEDADPTDLWFTRLHSLGGQGGPLQQYTEVMESLAETLEPESGLKNLGRRLIWKLEKTQIKSMLDTIERLKSLISIALQEDNL